MKDHITINNEIELSYPENFYPMETDELRKYFSSVKNRTGFRNAEHNMIISIGWTEPLNIFTSLLVDERSYIKGYDKRISKALKNYTRGETVSKQICGRTAEGFSYSFDASDTGAPHRGMIVAVRCGKRIFIAEYTTSCGDRLFCSMAFNMVIASMRIMQ